MLAGAIALYASYMTSRQSDFMRRSIEARTIALSTSIATRAAKDLAERDDGAIDSLLLQAENWPGVDALSVTDAEGRSLSAVKRHADGRLRLERIVAHLQPPDGSSAQVTGSERSGASSTSLVAWSPIDAKAVRGWVRAETSLAPLQEMRKQMLRDGIALGSAVLVLAAVAVTLLLRRPLVALREASDFAERLDTVFGSVLPPCSCAEELRQLRSALNRTSMRLSDQHAARVDGERRYSSMVEDLAEIVFQTDATLCWTHLNRSWETVTRYSVQEALGRPLHDFVVAEDLDKAKLALSALVSGESDTVALTARYRTKLGGIRWLETFVRARRDAAGHFIGVAGSASDVTQRWSAEQQVQHQQHLVRQLIDVVPSPIYIKDTKGRYLGVNRAFAQFFGQSQHELFDKTVFDLLPRNIAEWHQARDVALLAATGVQTFEARIPDRTGSVHDMLFRKSTFTRGDGSLAGIVGVITDLSERKQFDRELRAAKEAAEAASRAKSDFLANMSHEIRTPMNAIIGMTDLALDTAVNQAQREYLGMVKESADALLSIVNNILDFSRMTAGRVDYESIPYSLRDCVRRAVEAIGSRAKDKDLQLRWSVADTLPDGVVGDPHRLRQVLINLLDNAIKFTDAGGIGLDVVAVEQSSDRIRLQFSVHDSGSGIAHDRQQSIFEAFSQADTSATRAHGGAGLGLAICSRLVHGMGGEIWVDSEPGVGSTFYFTAQLGVFIVECRSADSPVLPHGSSVRALIVANNPVSRRQLEGLLASWSFGALAVAGRDEGAIALAEASRLGQPLKVILLEHAGSDDDEITAAAALRSHAPDAPIIVLTAAGLRGDAARCRELGISGYLVQPVPDGDLREAILLALAAPHAQGDASLITRHSLRERRRHTNALLAEEGALDPQPVLIPRTFSDGPAEHCEAPVARATSAIFDRNAVMENLEDDSDLFDAIVSSFLDSYAENLDQLQRAVAAGNFDAAYREIHSIKGAVGNFCAHAVVEAAIYASVCAQNGETAALDAAVDDLAAKTTALAAILQGELRAHSCAA